MFRKTIHPRVVSIILFKETFLSDSQGIYTERIRYSSTRIIPLNRAPFNGNKQK